MEIVIARVHNQLLNNIIETITQYYCTVSLIVLCTLQNGGLILSECESCTVSPILQERGSDSHKRHA